MRPTMKKIIPRYLTFCFLIAITCVAGCAPVTITPSTHPNLTTLGKITYVRVQDIKTRREGEQLQAYVTLLNSHRKNEVLYYRFRWLDSDGILVGDEPTWRTITFFGEQTKTLKGSTTNPGASDFNLEIAADKAKSLLN